MITATISLDLPATRAEREAWARACALVGARHVTETPGRVLTATTDPKPPTPPSPAPLPPAALGVLVLVARLADTIADDDACPWCDEAWQVTPDAAGVGRVLIHDPYCELGLLITGVCGPGAHQVDTLTGATP